MPHRPMTTTTHLIRITNLNTGPAKTNMTALHLSVLAHGWLVHDCMMVCFLMFCSWLVIFTMEAAWSLSWSWLTVTLILLIISLNRWVWCMLYDECVVLYICLYYNGCLLISELSSLSLSLWHAFIDIWLEPLVYMLLIWFSKLLQILNKDLGLMTRWRLF